MPDSRARNVSNLPVQVPDVPNAVTDISLVGLGGGSATVSFTANTYWPSNTYTAVSTPGSFTQTSATSPLTFTGLATGTSYTFAITGTSGPTPGQTVTSGAIIPSPLISQVSDTFATFSTGSTIATAYVLS